MDEEFRLLISFLENPVETDKREYKCAEPFDKSSNFSIKLIKHILAFGNSGGGHIVIGFIEDPTNKFLMPDKRLKDNIIKTYEVTKITQRINSILGNQDRIELHISKVE